MDKITNVVVQPLTKSMYIKPFTMRFTQNGRTKMWDLLTVHDSVVIVIHNISRNVLIFIKQFRPAVYFSDIPENERQLNVNINVDNYPAENGITLELCAGIVDKKVPLPEIAKDEILEECGYDVPLTNIEKIATYRSGTGTTGSRQTAFYCEVTDGMKVSAGGGINEEMLEVFEMTIDEVKKYICQDDIKSPSSLLLLMYWFIYCKLPNCSC